MMLPLQTMTSVLKVFTDIMMLPLQTMTSVLKVFTDIITSIIARPIRLAS